MSSKDQDELSSKLTRKYEVIADYMTSNKLKLNDDKTHLLVMMTDQKRRSINNDVDVKITTPTEIIEPSSCETLLGNVIHEGLKWAQYVMHGNPAPDGQKSLIYQLTSRLNGLKLICKVASFKTRLMVANGIFMSKLIYVMPLWAGCENYIVKALQAGNDDHDRSRSMIAIIMMIDDRSMIVFG